MKARLSDLTTSAGALVALCGKTLARKPVGVAPGDEEKCKRAVASR